MKIAFICNNALTIQVPIGITTIASVLKNAGNVVEYFPCEQPFEALVEQLKPYNPQILAYSSASGDIEDYLDLNRKLKKYFSSALSIFGGPHPTLAPDMINNDGVDVVCVAEGEYPMLEWVQELNKGNFPLDIPNLIIKDKNGEIHTNPPRNFIENLDELPYADHSFMNRFEFLRNSKIGFFMAGRGCPYSCTYCINNILRHLCKGNYLRWRSPEHIVGEIVSVVENFGIRFVNFQDDTFASDVKWFRKFVPLYKERVNLPYFCHVRANLITEELADLLRDSGCKIVAMGVESGSQTLREMVLRRNMTNDQIIKAAKMLDKNGIKVVTQNMIGLPDETVEDALQTIEVNMKCGVFAMNLWYFQPYPMVELTKTAQDKGQLMKDYKYPRSMAFNIALDLPDKDCLLELGKLFFYLADNPLLFAITNLFSKLPRSIFIKWLKLLNKTKPINHDRLKYDYFYNEFMKKLRAGEEISL